MLKYTKEPKLKRRCLYVFWGHNLSIGTRNCLIIQVIVIPQIPLTPTSPTKIWVMAIFRKIFFFREANESPRDASSISVSADAWEMQLIARSLLEIEQNFNVSVARRSIISAETEIRCPYRSVVQLSTSQTHGL